jgi:hypothetical protein
MIKYWTPEEDEIIKQARLLGIPVRQIKVPGRTLNAVTGRYTKLVREGKIPKLETNYYWSEEDKALLDSDLSNAEIAIKTGRSEEAVRYNRNISRVNLTDSQIEFLKENRYKNRQWIADQLGINLSKVKKAMSGLKLHRYENRDEYFYLYAVKKHGSTLNLKHNKTKDEPSYNTIVSYFGSWANACAIAGVSYNDIGLKKDKETTLYFIDFGDFKKVGITQQSIKARFAKYKLDYTILDFEVYENLSLALAAEREILSKVEKIAEQSILKSGASECFYSEYTSLLDLFSTLSI